MTPVVLILIMAWSGVGIPVAIDMPSALACEAAQKQARGESGYRASFCLHRNREIPPS